GPSPGTRPPRRCRHVPHSAAPAGPTASAPSWPPRRPLHARDRHRRRLGLPRWTANGGRPPAPLPRRGSGRAAPPPGPRRACSTWAAHASRNAPDTGRHLRTSRERSTCGGSSRQVPAPETMPLQLRTNSTDELGGNGLRFEPHIEVTVLERKEPRPEVPVPDPDVVEATAVDVPPASEQRENGRIDEQLLVPVRLRRTRPGKAGPLPELELSPPEQGDVPDEGGECEQGVGNLVHGAPTLARGASHERGSRRTPGCALALAVTVRNTVRAGAGVSSAARAWC